MTAPSRGRRVGRVVLQLVVAVVVLVLLAGGYVYWQARRITTNLHAERPLAIERVQPSAAQKKALRTRLKVEVAQSKALRLSGPELTLALQDLLRDRAVQRQLKTARAEIVSQLGRVDDPFGLVQRVRLEDVRLDQLVADVVFNDGVATVRATAPYKTSGHLNVTAVATGAYADRALTLDLRSLRVGTLDLLGLAGFGGKVRETLVHEVQARVARLRLREVKAARLEGDRLIVTVR